MILPKLPPPQATDSVAGWLQGLSKEEFAGAWIAEEATPLKLEYSGPITLEQKEEGPEEGLSFAKPYFKEMLQSSRSMDSGLGIEQLGKHLQAYLRFTKMKLAYLYQALKPKERNLFSVIPYLLHQNLPHLPSYVAGAPHGIRNFEFNLSIRHAAEGFFSRRGALAEQPPQRPHILSLLAMGSVGTIGQSGKSDVDYWVVVELDRLSLQQQRALKERIQKIEAWVQKRGLDAHFFLVDLKRSRANDFGGAEEDVDSSGSAQGKLLKEEFYRTAVLISGDIPAWWLVPVGVSAQGYQRVLHALERAQLPPGISVVDLGFIAEIDRGEFFGAALWQINKSLRSPFKSLLKMALLLRYLDDPKPRLLCDQLKERVFQGEDGPQYTDPYVLLFDAISGYFADRGDWKAFRLVQKCFYLKVGLKLSKERSERKLFMRRFQVMRAYIERWGWDRELLEELDSLESWSAEKVDEIGQQIRSFMLGLYRHLIRRAREATVHINEKDITILGRRLFAVFGREPGKIRHLFTYFLKEPRCEDRLVILEVPEALPVRRWEIHRELKRERILSRGEPIWSASTIAEIAGWLTFNGLYHSGTVVALISPISRVSPNELRGMLQRFQRIFESPDPFSIAPGRFLERRSILRVAVLVNFDRPRTLSDASEQAGVFYLPENWDILNYGRKRRCQLSEVSVLSLNSWGEVFCHRHSGPQAVPSALKSLFAEVEPQAAIEEVVVLAPSDRMLPAVRNRITELLRESSWVLVEPLKPRHSRGFVYEVGGRFQVIYRSADGDLLCGLRSLKGVCRILGNCGYDLQELKIDRLSANLGDLRLLVKRRLDELQPGVLIAWRLSPQRGQIFICDEIQRIYHRQLPPQDLEGILLTLVRRIILRLRESVRNTRELRRQLRIFHLRGPQRPGEQASPLDDTQRVLDALMQARSSREELWLGGDLQKGRAGLWFQIAQRRISAQEHGRAFVYETLLELMRRRSPYDADFFEIDASVVNFGPAHRQKGVDRGVVKHLRLIDLYENALKRALLVFRGEKIRSVTSRSPFRESP